MDNLILEQQRRVVAVRSKLKQNEPEVTAYISGLTTPLSAGQITKLNTFVRSLKTGLGISLLSDAFDVMYILAGETAESSLRNLVKRAHDAQAVNSPTFTALEGFTGNGTSSYLNSNYNPATQGINYLLNTCSAGCYDRTSSASNGALYGALSDSSNNYMQGLHRSTNNESFLILNEGPTASQKAENQTDGSGCHIQTRLSAISGKLYRNKNNILNSNKVSTGVPNNNIHILARNHNGTTNLYTNHQLSMVYFGKVLSDANVNAITDAIEAYMDSNGKGVIA